MEKSDKQRSEQNMASWKEWKLSDILFGIIVPTVVASLIIIFPMWLGPAVSDFDETLSIIFVDGLGEAILIVAIPMFLGLLWNQWAGGASGFLLGSVYALYQNDQYVAYQYQWNDVSVLGYLICAMLTGYIAGALNKGSYSFRRMLIAGLVAGMMGGLILFWTFIISPLGMATDVPYTLFITFLPRIIYGVIVPIFATVFGWYGLTPRQMS
jgi:hypothetical protein